LKGHASKWYQMSNAVPKAEQDNERINKVVIDHLPLAGNNWEVKSVEFFDATDHNNTLTQEYSRTAYRSDVQLRGNLLLMNERPSREGLFWLKEAPVSGVQLYYPGFDFSARFNDFKAVGVGIAPGDLSENDWVRGYSIVTGVASGGEKGLERSLRFYQQHLKPTNPEVDNMIMLNTWGDRGQDKNINEAFILNEISLGAKLGITHLQMDDGWQTGRSGASIFPGGSLEAIWRNPNYWKPDSLKFPDGFYNIMAAAKKQGITISTWFNPSTDNSFKNWSKDAAVLIDQYKKYGIHVWKIDGVKIEDKQAEINFRKMLDTVVASTNHQAVFNLDVTAGKRFGYNYFYEYGNLFLENRYTDWGNYYPHFTLRNLWMLSKYLPPQHLQIEFLNKWRNTNKYPRGDLFAPERYSFDYLFAITLPAQPLAWMEARHLPPEAFKTAALIKTYKKYWKEWHSGQIFPIGEEPSGISWTGFQSVLKDKASGYVLVFREMTDRKRMVFQLEQLAAGKYKFELLAGDSGNFTTTIDDLGKIKIDLPHERSFVLYRYHLIR
ncbi:MAG: alpha-galactosidase, partial [Ginsengibacter sp.]